MGECGELILQGPPQARWFAGALLDDYRGTGGVPFRQDVEPVAADGNEAAGDGLFSIAGVGELLIEEAGEEEERRDYEKPFAQRQHEVYNHTELYKMQECILWEISEYGRGRS
jgi:hypothetical protein